MRKRAPGRLRRVKLRGKEIVEFCRHSLDRMANRGVSEDEVIKAIRHPNETGLPAERGRERVSKNRSRDESIHVVYKQLPDRILIVTVWVKRRGKRR